MSAGQGSSGNVIAAVCSFFIPGLGQLVQGGLLRIIHLWSILDAAPFKPSN
jgi:hypothetical protein